MQVQLSHFFQKNLIQVTFAAHEAMVDEVANQVENK